MKRLIVFLVIGVLALAGIFIFTRSRSSVPPPIAEINNPSPATTAATVPMKIPAAPSVAKIVSTDAENNFAAFDRFSRWAENFTNGTVTLIEGERLAWQRREAMLELIQTDPKQAIEMSVPFELRQSLPKQITKFLEEQIDGRGNFEVMVGTDFSSGSTTTFRKVQLGDRRFDAFVKTRGVLKSIAFAVAGRGDGARQRCRGRECDLLRVRQICELARVAGVCRERRRRAAFLRRGSF